MFIKIYFDQKPLFLCDAIDKSIEPYIHHDDAVFIDDLNPHTIKAMIHEMQQANVHAGVFLHSDLAALQKAFFKKFTVVKAAGGLVQNDKSQVLLIFRRGKWDLPKGKLDKGETLETCAVREVEEETGLRKPEIISPLLVTYHTYHEGTKFVLKESHWYLMKIYGEQLLVPQQEEDIQETKWVCPGDSGKYMQNSYPAIADVLEAGGTA